MKKITIFIAASVFLLMNVVPACALELTGQSAYLTSQCVFSDFEGTVDEVFLKEGIQVSEGDLIMTIRTGRVYSDMDATVRGVNAKEGDVFREDAFALEPKEKYKLLATTTYAMNTAENTVVHPGETVYISCIKDFTHVAVGYIASVDQDEYTIYTTRGTLYPGEAVNVYRDESRDYMTRIGRATVYAADLTKIEETGRAVRLYVKEGDRVEKGEILMEYLPGENAPESPEIDCSVNGIVTQIYVQAGDAVSKGDKLFEYVRAEDVGIKAYISQSDMAQITLDMPVDAICYADIEESVHPAAVSAIVKGESDQYEVYIALDSALSIPRIGMTFSIRTGNSR